MYRLLPQFTVSARQAIAYPLGVALFSISFLVFLNSSISFVVTDVVGQKERVGDAVGTLGFADELLALVACPLWGLVSDRLGVRNVAVTGYIIIGISLICLVQSKHVYPDLLIFRLLFSLGAAACSTMVTAILPVMTAKRESGSSHDPESENDAVRREAPRAQSDSNVNRHSMAFSISSELTITPARYESRSNSSPGLSHRRRSDRISEEEEETSPETEGQSNSNSNTSQLAGFVGMFTGIGALLALVVFLPLPATLGKDGNISKASAVQRSFYIVGAIAVVVGVFVFWGLSGLPGEEHKGPHFLFNYNQTAEPKGDASHNDTSDNYKSAAPSYLRLLHSAIVLGFTDSHIALGYLGGFVARASSVGISLFIPLFVNAYFIREGLCSDDPSSVIKESCKRAYTTASMLTGISQLVALLSAPLFGYFNAHVSHRPYLSSLPLAIGAIAGVVGCIFFGLLQSPDPFSSEPGGKAAILAVILLGISQIGAIVCSLGLLSQGIQTPSLTRPAQKHQQQPDAIARSDAEGLVAETAPLLPSASTTDFSKTPVDRSQLKGTIAGVYSLAGGAGILLLTKLGGVLFDRAATGAPFFMLAGFNAVLLVATVGITIGRDVKKRVVSEIQDEEDDN